MTQGSQMYPETQLFDRKSERERMIAAVGKHPRILVQGSDDAGVSEFAAWLVSACRKDREVIYWDFETAPGVEGLDILQKLSEGLASAAHFEEARATLRDEFSKGPPVHATQSVGQGATAGRNQKILTEMHVPSLTDYLSRNLWRLAKAFFEDVQSCCADKPVVLVFYGMRVGGERPLPTRDLLEVLVSSMWRLAEQCSPKDLCVVLAATVSNPRDLRLLGKPFDLTLDVVHSAEACAVMTEVIPGLSLSEATAVIQASVAPRTNGISYAGLQERMTYLLLNRVEPSIVRA